MDSPTLSVVFPNYNNAKTIPNALEAILNQSFQPKEIIFVDDCSTDNSVEVIESYVQKYPFIKLYLNEKNMGLYFTINRCLENVTGDYMHGTSGDDPILPGFYEKSLSMLAQYPEAGLCTTLCFRVDDDGNELPLVPEPPYPSRSPIFIPAEKMLNAITKQEFEIMSSTTIWNVNILREVGGVPDLKHIEDTFLNLLLAQNHGVCFIPEPLGKFLVSTHSGSEIYRTNPEAVVQIAKKAQQLMTSEKYKKYFPPALIAHYMSRQQYRAGTIALTNLSKADNKSLEDIKDQALQNLSTIDRLFFLIISFIFKSINFFVKLYLFARLRRLTWKIFMRVFYRLRKKLKHDSGE